MQVVQAVILATNCLALQVTTTCLDGDCCWKCKDRVMTCMAMAMENSECKCANQSSLNCNDTPICVQCSAATIPSTSHSGIQTSSGSTNGKITTTAEPSTTIVIASITSITVIIITVIILLMLALYWRYRIKFIKERNSNMQTNLSYNVNTQSTNVEAQDPVYSIIADDQTASKLPELPPDRVPYYQEIESDKLGADYEIPIKSRLSPQQSFEQHTEKTEESLEEPYQDPVDALA